MKYLGKILLALTLLLAVVACEDENPILPEENGSVYVVSTPAGAQIFLNGENTGQLTPDTVDSKAGVQEITLSMANYEDTTFSISITAGQVGVVNVVLARNSADVTVSSNPVGAEIWINGSNSGFVTPKTFTNMPHGIYTVTLKKENFEDYTQVVTVAGTLVTLDVVLAPLYSTYSTIRLWETVGTTSTQPSGLDLSTGSALSISTTAGVNANVDIYYSSAGFIVRSANGENGMTRETYFKVAAGSDLNDGVDSPVKDANWDTQILDTETDYVFLYDADGNYSKFKIVARGGGFVGEPAWVDVSWIYNKAANNTNF